MSIILVFPLDLRPPWGTLTKFQALVSHYIHETWHTLPSLSAQSFVNLGNGPPCLSPLDTKVIYWDIPKHGICLLKLFGGIGFKLVVVLQSSILVQRYHYVKKDSQAKQTSM